MKKIFWLSLFFSAILLSSCKTSSVLVPGEKQISLKQMYSEYYAIAEEYVKLENYTKAIEYYEFSMKDKSLRTAAYYKIGQCYAKNKQYDKAYEVFSNIAKKDPDNTSIKSSLAYLTAMKGDVKEAARLYSQLVVSNPESAETLVNYISVLITLKDYETASLNLEHLEKKYPSTTQIASLKENLEKLKESQNK